MAKRLKLGQISRQKFWIIKGNTINVQQVQDMKFYQDFFAKVDKSIFLQKMDYRWVSPLLWISKNEGKNIERTLEGISEIAWNYFDWFIFVWWYSKYCRAIPLQNIPGRVEGFCRTKKFCTWKMFNGLDLVCGLRWSCDTWIKRIY